MIKAYEINQDEIMVIDRRKKSILHNPIKVIEFYLLCTIILYMFGPWDWPTHNPILFYIFIALAQFALWLGYKVGEKKKIIENTNRVSDTRVLRFLKYVIIINLIFTVLNTIRNTGMSSFSLNILMQKAQNGILNPAQQYRDKFTDGELFGGGILTHLSVLLSPILWSVIPLSIYYFKKLNLINKILTIMTIIIEASRWMATGTNKGIIDLIVIFITITFVSKKQKIYESFEVKDNAVKKKGIVLITVLGLILALSFFSNAIGSRVKENWDNLIITNGGVQINFNSALMLATPKFLQATLVYLTSYVTQGYYALSMAITLPFTPMFGTGNSVFIMNNVSSIINIDLFQYTYQVKLSFFGWDPLVNWHSFYVWIANDVSFIGVIVVMFVLGYYFCLVFQDAIINKSPVAMVIICLLVLLFIYIPANNQVLSYPTTSMTFWVLTLFWIIQRCKVRRM